MAIAWSIGAGLGLGSLSGFRSFIPLAIYMLFARVGWVWGFGTQGTAFDFMLSNVAVALVLALVILEIIITRLPALMRIDTLLRPPLAIIVGALLTASAFSGGFDSAVNFIGLPAGAALAALGLYVYQGLMIAGEGADPGPALDFSVLVFSVLMMLVPPSGYLLLLAVLWLAWRVRRLKRLKYKGLRVLA